MKHAWALSEEHLQVLRHLPPEIKKRVRDAFDEISHKPSLGKELIENLKGYRSYRVGRMRIVYEVRLSRLFLVTLGPRKTVYQEAILQLKRRLDKNH